MPFNLTYYPPLTKGGRRGGNLRSEFCDLCFCFLDPVFSQKGCACFYGLNNFLQVNSFGDGNKFNLFRVPAGFYGRIIDSIPDFLKGISYHIA